MGQKTGQKIPRKGGTKEKLTSLCYRHNDKRLNFVFGRLIDQTHLWWQGGLTGFCNLFWWDLYWNSTSGKVQYNWLLKYLDLLLLRGWNLSRPAEVLLGCLKYQEHLFRCFVSRRILASNHYYGKIVSERMEGVHENNWWNNEKVVRDNWAQVRISEVVFYHGTLSPRCIFERLWILGILYFLYDQHFITE